MTDRGGLENLCWNKFIILKILLEWEDMEVWVVEWDPDQEEEEETFLTTILVTEEDLACVEDTVEATAESSLSTCEDCRSE